MHRVREINDIAELAELRGAWHSLLEQTAGATFFSTLEWLEVYWRHFGEEQRLRTLVVTEGKETIGILPLVVRRERRRVGPLRTLTYPLDDWGSFYGPIGPDRKAILVAGLQHVCRTSRNWDLIDLRYVDETGTDNGTTRDAMRRTGLQAYRKVRDRVAMVCLPETYNIFLAGQTSKWRHKLKRWQRDVARCGELTFERNVPQVGETDPRWDLYDTCEEVARSSWQGNSISGTTLSHDSIRPFLREVHEAATRLGAADMSVLRLNGRPVAFAYNYVWRGYIYGLRTGFDTQACRAGVGNLICVNIVRDSISRGYHTYDLGPGSLAGKRHIQTTVKNVLQYSHYHRGAPRAQLLRLKHMLGCVCDRSAHPPQSAGTATRK